MYDAFARIAATTFTVMALALAFSPAEAQDEGPLPERVTFLSADGRTRLVGYVYKPVALRAARVPAVVMMHGRAGAYSSLARGVYDASTLSQRHKAWGREWADAGYIAILVDGFGPRGYPQGFGRHTYGSRPAELDEVTARPLDAYGALAYLRTRPDVMADRIGLLGWSNGGSTAISTMSVEAPGITSPTPETGFRAALVYYAGCGLKGVFEDKPFRPYAPVLFFHGTADEEVSYKRCSTFVERSRAQGGNVEIKLLPGATHSFDSPSRKRQSNEANASATDDAVARSRSFFVRYLGSKAQR